MVLRFLPTSSVDIDSLVISQSSKTEKSALHHWDENPAAMITELLVRDLDSSGLFEKTVDQLSSARYSYALEGTIRDLQGIIQDGKGKAVIEVEATLTPVGRDKNLLKKLYKIEVPLPDTTPNSIIKGLDLGVKELSEGLRKDIRAALEPKAPEPEKKAPRKAARPTPKTSIKSRK
jgi:ABC-type uncharacterized transport system auxiliary subunit